MIRLIEKILHNLVPHSLEYLMFSFAKHQCLKLSTISFHQGFLIKYIFLKSLLNGFIKYVLSLKSIW